MDFRERLAIEPYTVSAGDLLLTKLQVFRAEERDLRDIVTLLKDDELAGEDAPGTVNVKYWPSSARGTGGSTTTSRRTCGAARSRWRATGWSARDEDHVRAALERLTEEIEEAPKTRSWRWRAKIGTRRRWHELVEEQDGGSP